MVRQSVEAAVETLLRCEVDVFAAGQPRELLGRILLKKPRCPMLTVDAIRWALARGRLDHLSSLDCLVALAATNGGSK